MGIFSGKKKDDPSAGDDHNPYALVKVDEKRHLPAVKVKKDKQGEIRTTESFGIEAVIDSRPGMFSPIIPVESLVPVSRKKRYYPVDDNQKTIKVKCFKGESNVAQRNIKLGEFVITGIRPHPKADAKGVDITFTVDRLGVILVDAVEVENPDNHLKVKLNYIDAREGLVKGVAKGVLKEVVGILLPSGKRR